MLLILLLKKTNNTYLYIFYIIRTRPYKESCSCFCLTSYVFPHTIPNPLKTEFVVGDARFYQMGVTEFAETLHVCFGH